jgi:hypothetical protein
LGLGVTPSAWSWKALQVGSFGGFFATNSAAYASYLGNNAYYDGSNWRYIASSGSVHYELAGGDRAHKWYNAASGTAGNAITFTQAMTLDASGNLLVGTTSAWGGNPKAEFRQTTNNNWGLSTYNSGTSANVGAFLARVDNTGVYLAGFYFGGSTLAGTITTNGTGVTYGSASDYRLKENVAPITNALSKIAQLKPVTYIWKSNQSNGIGFLAHELQSVFPDAVTGEKNQIGADGKEVYQNVDTGSSSIIATLTAAIQEQQAIITQLQADVAALKGA